MNHSIYSADRGTHLKIVVVALCAGIVVASVGLFSRNGGHEGNVHSAQITKAGKPVLMTGSSIVAVR